MVENIQYIKMLKRMIRAGSRRVGAADEIDLKKFAQLRGFLDDQIKESVQMQLQEGKSWQDIGSALGISRQAACKRFSS